MGKMHNVTSGEVKRKKCRQGNQILRGQAEKIWCHRHQRYVAINSDEQGRSCGDTQCRLSPAFIKGPVLQEQILQASV